MRCFIRLAFFALFPSLLAGPLSEDDFEDFYGPSSLDQSSPSDADIFAGNPSGDDTTLAATGGLEANPASGEPSLFSLDSPTTDSDQLLLVSSCDTAGGSDFGKLRARDEASCINKAGRQPLQLPNIFPANQPSPEKDSVPIPSLSLEFNVQDKCPAPYTYHLCCELGPEFDVQLGAGASIAVYDVLGGCYISTMTVLLVLSQ